MIMLQYQIDHHAKDIPQGLLGPGLPLKMTEGTPLQVNMLMMSG